MCKMPLLICHDGRLGSKDQSPHNVLGIIDAPMRDFAPLIVQDPKPMGQRLMRALDNDI